MMERTLRLRSRIRDDEGGDEVQQITVPCQISEKDREITVKYREKDGSDVILWTDGVRFRMKRQGPDTSSDFLFEEGVRTKSEYVTPFGTFDAEINNRQVSVRRTDKTYLFAEYDVYLSGQHVSYVVLKVVW